MAPVTSIVTPVTSSLLSVNRKLSVQRWSPLLHPPPWLAGANASLKPSVGVVFVSIASLKSTTTCSVRFASLISVGVAVTSVTLGSPSSNVNVAVAVLSRLPAASVERASTV